MEAFDFTPDVPEAIIQTMEDFQVIYTAGSGAVLYPSRLASTSLHENLSAASIASTLRLSSVDYANRRYGPFPEPTVAPVIDAFRRASLLGRQHVSYWLNALKPDGGRAVSFGVYAATVAMHRATAGFSAAHMMYSLGYNYEGDAVARQILEQIAWAFVASASEEDQVRKVSATASIARLRRDLLPYAGRLYGLLSQSAHADLDEHQAVFNVNGDDRGIISLAWSRYSGSAAHLLDLADAWATTWQYVQFDYLDEFDSLTSDKKLDQERAFIRQASAAIDEINSAEDQSTSA